MLRNHSHAAMRKYLELTQDVIAVGLSLLLFVGMGLKLFHLGQAFAQGVDFRETERSRRERGQTIRVEKTAPITPPSEEVTTLGEEILDFHQPDDALKIEDVLPDIRTPSPEEDLELRELRRCVREALNQLPKEHCRALVRCYAFGLDRDEAARERLRQLLIDSGCAFEPCAAERSPATAWNTAGNN